MKHLSEDREKNREALSNIFIVVLSILLRIIYIYKLPLEITSGHCGFLEDVSLTFIDKTHPSDPLKREDYWRNTPKTMEPFGLNIEESV